jgi:hypothetical protein
MSEHRFTNLKVLNKNDFVISDRFDGVPYEFKPGEALTIPGDAAHHMLGWLPGIPPEAVFLHVQKRWGWNTPDLAPKSREFFANLDLKPVTFKMVEVQETEEVFDEPDAAPQPPPPARSGAKRNRITADAPA